MQIHRHHQTSRNWTNQQLKAMTTCPFPKNRRNKTPPLQRQNPKTLQTIKIRRCPTPTPNLKRMRPIRNPPIPTTNLPKNQIKSQQHPRVHLNPPLLPNPSRRMLEQQQKKQNLQHQRRQQHQQQQQTPSPKMETVKQIPNQQPMPNQNRQNGNRPRKILPAQRQPMVLPTPAAHDARTNPRNRPNRNEPARQSWKCSTRTSPWMRQIFWPLPNDERP
mmetsp:Transcript_1696/g.4164  ORF Transcript_1696/g.4164 Transcript_1696/m.4164 type:complete len:218 (-) Transcript_1696:2375-3028(-)